MARYQVMHDYASNAFGPWFTGAFVELDPEQADWVNHDSPGTLERIDPEKQAAEKREAKAAAEAARRKAKKEPIK